MVQEPASALYPWVPPEVGVEQPASPPLPSGTAKRHGRHDLVKTGRAYPPTRVETAVDVLHGVGVADPYRWLEDGCDLEVRAWIDDQNALTRAVLASVPDRDLIGRRLEQVLAIGSISAPVIKGGRFFCLRREEGEEQPILFCRDGAQGRARPVIDPARYATQTPAALDWWYPSPDGSLLAFGISHRGDEQSTLRVRSVDAGSDLGDCIPHTRLASVAWLPDSSGFFYTRYPVPGSVTPGEEFCGQKVFLHVVDADWRQDPEIFAGAKEGHLRLNISPDGRWLCVVAWVWTRTALYLMDRRDPARAIVPLVDDVDAHFVPVVANDRIYVRTNLGTPSYRILAIDPGRPRQDEWVEVVPAAADTLESHDIIGRYLVCHYLHNASSLLKLHDLEHGTERPVTLPGVGSLEGWSGEPAGDRLFLAYASFTSPPAVYLRRMSDGTEGGREAVQAAIDAEGFETRQVWYASRDGTRISMFLVHRTGLPIDGNRPTLIYGYGGFNVPLVPSFSRTIYLLLERDGIFAMPNLRGGGEYGEAWHQAGMLTRKQNTFDDCIAAAEYLIGEGYTRPQRLALQGASNGGLLVGAVLTQRPELFAAAVCEVPVLDMLRYHLFGFGRFAATEYGTCGDAEQFAALHAYSPYHRIRDGVRYPALLVTTGESDTRADPMHARKFVARLQKANSADTPILLRTDFMTGHGPGKPLRKVIEEQMDVWAFLFRELGVTFGIDR